MPIDQYGKLVNRIVRIVDGGVRVGILQPCASRDNGTSTNRDWRRHSHFLMPRLRGGERLRDGEVGGRTTTDEIGTDRARGGNEGINRDTRAEIDDMPTTSGRAAS